MSEIITPVNIDEQSISRLTSLFKDDEVQKSLLQTLNTPYVELQNDLIFLVDNMLNIDVATGSHLDIIGNLIGQPRELIDFDTERYFGFQGSHLAETFGTLSDPNVGGYWNSFSHMNVGRSRRVSDELYRRLIRARSIKNNTNCSMNDLVEVVNLLTGRNDAIVRQDKHRLIKIKFTDTWGLMSYYLDRVELPDGVLPVAYGVKIESEE